MRVTINTKLFKHFEFLSADEIRLALKLIDLFAENNSYEIELEIDVKKLNFLLTRQNNVIQLNKEMVKLFDKNTENVRKFRAKKKQNDSETSKKVIVTEAIRQDIETGIKSNKSDDENIKIERSAKTVDKDACKTIATMFNETFKDTVMPQIQKVSPKVMNQIHKVYDRYKDKIDGNPSMVEFYEMYFNMFHERRQIRDGWKWERAKDGWFVPTFDTIMRLEALKEIIENDKKFM